MGQDGLQQWMEMWSMSRSRGLVVQQRRAAWVAAKKGKNFGSANPALLWCRADTLR